MVMATISTILQNNSLGITLKEWCVWVDWKYISAKYSYLAHLL